MSADAVAVPERGVQWARAIAARVVAFGLTLLGAVASVQVLIALAPGNAVDLLPNAPELRAALEREWGLDQPLPIRIVNTFGQFLRGDLGTSLTYRPGAPVADLLGVAGVESLALLVPALVLGIAIAVPLAAWTSGRPTQRTQRAIQAVSVIPAFLAAYLAVMGLNALTWALLERGLIDRPEWFALPDAPGSVRTALAITVLALASGGLTEMHMVCETELRRLRAAPFVDAARARGAAVWPHLLHNLVPTVATLLASRTATLLGSLVVVEKVLLFSGAGAMLWQACRQRDYPLAIGITLVAAAVVCGARLAADLVRVSIDPRLRSAA